MEIHRHVLLSEKSSRAPAIHYSITWDWQNKNEVETLLLRFSLLHNDIECGVPIDADAPCQVNFPSSFLSSQS